MAGQFIDVRQLTIRYGNTLAVANLCIQIRLRRMLAICGPNGAGKSTLLKCLAGIIAPDEGSISGLSGMRISYLGQSHHLDRDFPITTMDVVSMGLWHETGPMRGLSRQQYERCMSALQAVGLENHDQRPISSLSGGQFQRALFARTMLQDADVVLLDEPFQGIDVQAAACMMDLIRNMHARGKTIIVVLHDHQLAQANFSRIVLLSAQLIASGHPDEVLSAANIEHAYRGVPPADKQVPLRRSHAELTAQYVMQAPA